MASIGIAPAFAPTRAIIGPVQSQAGFQYWYLVCFPDCIVAVRQGIWAGLLLAMSGTTPPAHLGVLGYLLVALLKSRGSVRRKLVEAEITNTPTSRLRMQPNLVFEIPPLRAITLKGKSFGGLITPDITFETASGTKQKFGIQKPDYDKACPQLKLMYPALCKLI